jgi:hypothetical protein
VGTASAGSLTMHSRRVAAVVLVALSAGLTAVPAVAHPPAPVDAQGQPMRGEAHTWLHHANVPMVRGRFRIIRSPCPQHPAFVGCVFNLRPRTLFISPVAGEPRLILYHELGHVFDLKVLNARERRRFKRILGIHRSGWFGGGLPPSEWFADGYASCAVRGRLRTPTPYGFVPSTRQHARVCHLIRAAAKPRGRPPERPRKPPPVLDVKPPPPEESQPAEGGCNLLDELLTGCTPASPPAPLGIAPSNDS